MMWGSLSWGQLLLIPVAMLFFPWAIGILDARVTHVRARYGLAMAWGTAILGMIVIFGGIALISAVPVLLA